MSLLEDYLSLKIKSNVPLSSMGPHSYDQTTMITGDSEVLKTYTSIFAAISLIFFLVVGKIFNNTHMIAQCAILVFSWDSLLYWHHTWNDWHLEQIFSGDNHYLYQFLSSNAKTIRGPFYLTDYMTNLTCKWYQPHVVLFRVIQGNVIILPFMHYA